MKKRIPVRDANMAEVLSPYVKFLNENEFNGHYNDIAKYSANLLIGLYDVADPKQIRENGTTISNFELTAWQFANDYEKKNFREFTQRLENIYFNDKIVHRT